MHLSMTSSDDERERVKSFLAGILDLLRPLCAFTLPSHDSYSRIRDLSGTTSTFVTWGTEIRDVPIRKVDHNHWELRCLDATANMYLAAASVIAAGIEGVRSKCELK